MIGESGPVDELAVRALLVVRREVVVDARLAEEIGLDRSVVSRHAARLTRAGLLEREMIPRTGEPRFWS